MTMNVLDRTIEIKIQPIDIDAQVYDEDSNQRELLFVIGNYLDRGGEETVNYNKVVNKPKINDVELVGNKTAALLGLQPTLTIDAIPTEDSTNPVQSGGVYDALAGKQDTVKLYTQLGFNEFSSSTSYNAGDKVVYQGLLYRFVLPHSGAWTGTDVDDTDLNLELAMAFGDIETNKADKVSGATQDNLAGLDSEGNLTDSGIAASDVSAKYTKPSTGIPKTDLASDVQTSLGKADTALQSYTETDPVFAASAAHGISSSDISNWNAKGTYSKPSGGIPKTDLDSSVQTSLGKADTALQSYTETDPVFQASAAAGITSGDISNWDGKADKVVYVDASTPPSTMDANKVYQYGTLSGNTTFPAFTAVSSGDTEVKIWCWTFTTPSTAPTITWPAGITAWNGGSAPTINASKNYEVSVMDGVACIIETDIPT